MKTSEAFNHTIPDIVSELAYLASKTTNLEDAALLIRAARLIQSNRKELSNLKHQAYLDSWDKYPERMGQ